MNFSILVLAPVTIQYVSCKRLLPILLHYILASDTINLRCEGTLIRMGSDGEVCHPEESAQPSVNRHFHT